MKTPHLYGQSHPFSICNIDNGSNEIQFVLRIKHGLTSTLAKHITSLCKAKNVGSAPVTVSVEGPYGFAPPAHQFDSVLLVAGGSGITHVASVLASVCKKAEEGVAAATNVHLVWAIHHLGTFSLRPLVLINFELLFVL